MSGAKIGYTRGMSGYVGRYAPSPTGDLHLGNALAAFCAWAQARRQGGRCLLRIEDLDTPRVVPGSAARLQEDLAALGLHFDGEVLTQSAHLGRYQAALDTLRARGLVYGCACTRKELSRAASAPHAGEEGPPYPGTCRDKGLPLADPARPVSWRFRVGPGRVRVEDRWQGTLEQDVAAEVGDFVLKRRDGIFAYQLAVVVDDLFQGVTEVVRGRDLLSSAPRQVLLARALGGEPPRFAHLPLWVDEAGQRLSKRRGEEPTLLRVLRAQESAGRILGRLGRALGVCSAGEEIDAPTLAARLQEESLQRAEVRSDPTAPLSRP